MVLNSNINFDIRIFCVIFYYFLIFKFSDKISDYGQVEFFKRNFIILNRQCYRCLCVYMWWCWHHNSVIYLFIYIYSFIVAPISFKINPKFQKSFLVNKLCEKIGTNTILKDLRWKSLRHKSLTFWLLLM